ncbi:hypothetical protein BDK51DRAFT_45087 [Blyttiomyces helicus]|uniref:TFIIS N-terminal domain-containing protein n=1 Tax=Blyttiomyces helicus TaxID=388810 RepID=A0A4P9WGT7_9FUNG|nr:hypothetical protein BDK51DRAFT_45087 [Blyttiomyces helicus]|eukprot:RKO92019.1 hypothetical protein BDK51DRAFT_45087 [Blyttiomyces helicus]
MSAQEWEGMEGSVLLSALDYPPRGNSLEQRGDEAFRGDAAWMKPKLYIKEANGVFFISCERDEFPSGLSAPSRLSWCQWKWKEVWQKPRGMRCSTTRTAGRRWRKLFQSQTHEYKWSSSATWHRASRPGQEWNVVAHHQQEGGRRRLLRKHNLLQLWRDRARRLPRARECYGRVHRGNAKVETAKATSATALKPETEGEPKRDEDIAQRTPLLAKSSCPPRFNFIFALRRGIRRGLPPFQTRHNPRQLRLGPGPAPRAARVPALRVHADRHARARVVPARSHPRRPAASGDLWRALRVFTHEYFELCSALVGKPAVIAYDPRVEELASWERLIRDGATLGAYSVMFGRVPESPHWGGVVREEPTAAADADDADYEEKEPSRSSREDEEKKTKRRLHEDDDEEDVVDEYHEEQRSRKVRKVECSDDEDEVCRLKIFLESEVGYRMETTNENLGLHLIFALLLYPGLKAKGREGPLSALGQHLGADSGPTRKRDRIYDENVRDKLQILRIKLQKFLQRDDHDVRPEVKEKDFEKAAKWLDEAAKTDTDQETLKATKLAKVVRYIARKTNEGDTHGIQEAAHSLVEMWKSTYVDTGGTGLTPADDAGATTDGDDRKAGAASSGTDKTKGPGK